jgi:septum formation protein
MEHLPLPHPGDPSQVRLILASSSPRRRELLAQYGYSFEVLPLPADAEEPAKAGEAPEALVARLALQKARAVAAGIQSGVLLTCDTVAACRGRILGKPRDVEDAREMLRWQRGREQEVYSGLCVWPLPHGQPRVAVAVTRLRMAPISDEQLEEYLSSGLWEGKAGAFGYQDRLGWLEILEGSETNVVGLPMELLAELVQAAEGAEAGPAVP